MTASLIKRLQNAVDDPMWADHAEISKKALQEAIDALQSQHWSEIPGSNPYKRLTDLKTKSIMERDGFEVAGYILLKGEDRICLSYGCAIRWMDTKRLFNIMHCIGEKDGED